MTFGVDCRVDYSGLFPYLFTPCHALRRCKLCDDGARAAPRVFVEKAPFHHALFCFLCSGTMSLKRKLYVFTVFIDHEDIDG